MSQNKDLVPGIDFAQKVKSIINSAAAIVTSVTILAGAIAYTGYQVSQYKKVVEAIPELQKKSDELESRVTLLEQSMRVFIEQRLGDMWRDVQETKRTVRSICQSVDCDQEPR